MNRRLTRIALAGVVSVAVFAFFASTASANFHLMKISEVHFVSGTDDDFVELQMYADGQNSVGGHFLRLYTNTGATQGTFTFPSGVLNGGSQRTILIGNNSVFGADFNSSSIEPNLMGGAACFLDSLGTPDVGIDCVAWGSFDGTFDNGTPSPVGAPVAPGGLSSGQSLTRTISRGCPTLLEAGDDTDSSIGDFALTGASPRNNATAPSETPCTAAIAPTPTTTSFNLQAAIKKCKKKFAKGTKARKKCIRKARQRAAA